MIKLIILLLILAVTACKSKNTADVQTTFVRSGTFTEELTEEGTLRSLNSIAINAPVLSYRYGGLKITNIVDDGKEVKESDTLIVFDLSEISKAILDSEQRLTIASAELEKMIATQESAIADLEADMEIARISREISRINLEQAEHESEISRREIALRLQNADIALERAKEQIENRKRINQEDLFQKNISIRQLQSVLDEAHVSINNLYVVSPAHGIAILESNWMSGQKWQAGEQPFSGSKLIELPDLSKMTAEIKINEVDVSKILPGMEVEIVTDAYSGITYHGEIISIANLAQNKDNRSRIKVFPVQIIISDTSENLMPGLTASCRIKIREVPDVMFIPLESLFREEGMEFVYIKTNTGFKKQEVKTGVSNTSYIVVTEGLDGGEELALAYPFVDENNDIAINK